MSSITQEIQQLQLRILELEKLQKDESDKKTSIEHNFNVINDLLTEKQTAINNRCPNSDDSLPRRLVTNYDHTLVRHLEATYNILKIVDERLKKIENRDI